MRRPSIFLLAVLALGVTALPGAAEDVPIPVLAKDLLLPCQEADNDARDGFLSEMECIGFIGGFAAALDLTGEGVLCFPETNREDETRRAYVRWVHKSFSKRGKMPVGEALLAALSESFACE